MRKYRKIYKLSPSLHANIWGGDKLREYGKESNEDRIGESWELSFVKGAEATVEGGAKTTELFSRDAWGENCQSFEDFPVLTKFIDAREKLSVQVHPSDEYALKNEGMYGKSEMWYVVSAEEGAGLYMGLNRECSTEEFSQKVADGTVEELLSFKTVKPGDVFFIPAGTIHAIGAGVLIYEIQQNSTLTYRLYDYMRRDKNGNLRELHVDKAMKVSKLVPYSPESYEDDEIIGKCKYFVTKKYDFNGELRFFDVTNDSYLMLTVVDGKGSVHYTDFNGERVDIGLQAGDSYFMPSGSGAFTADGYMTLITVETPKE